MAFAAFFPNTSLLYNLDFLTLLSRFFWLLMLFGSSWLSVLCYCSI